MLSENPLNLLRGGKLGKEGVLQALRLAIIGELDAINLYMQLAEAVEDEGVRKVLADIADDEKTHVGELLALLKELDPEQAKRLASGAEEVEELTGIKS
ncbi:MAG: rubrerythrin [Desulfurococcales archaeon]|nr:rubrerythrin [Desulfurococcales archaeon]